MYGPYPHPRIHYAMAYNLVGRGRRPAATLFSNDTRKNISKMAKMF